MYDQPFDQPQHISSSLPDTPTARGDRCQDVHFFVQSERSGFAIEACLELLDVANQMAGRHFYRTAVHHGLTGLSQVPSARMGQTVILFGNIFERWKLNANTRKLVRSKLPCIGRLGFVGGGVFTCADIPKFSHHSFAIHPNLHHAALESGLTQSPNGPPFHRDDHVFSAIGGIAALHMVTKLIAEDLGEYTAQSVEAFVGLSKRPQSQGTMQRCRYMRLAEGRPLLLRCLAKMYDHVEHPISSRELAAAVSSSPRHIERSFREVLGDTPMAIYRNVRLERAYQLLLQTDMPVLDICIATGFPNRSNFSGWFRARYGQLPLQARKQRYSGQAG